MIMSNGGRKASSYNGKGGAGFMFEDAMVEVNKLIPDGKHTGVWDAYIRRDKTPVAIKHFNRENEMVFELIRQYDLKVDSFILLVGIYDKNNKYGSKYKVDTIYKVIVPKAKWLKLMDEELVNIARKMKSIVENKSPSKESWDKAYDTFKDRWEAKGHDIITPRFRYYEPEEVGDDPRFRFQCAIRYNQFIKHFIESGEYKYEAIEKGVNSKHYNLLFSMENFMKKYGFRVAMNGNKILPVSQPVGAGDYTTKQWNHIMALNAEANDEYNEKSRKQKEREKQLEREKKMNLFDMVDVNIGNLGGGYHYA